MEEHRPTWSVMIPTYDSNDHLRQTLESVLVQDMGRERMQIEVVDDASPNHDTKSLVREVAGERVDVFIQPQNLGLVGNFTSCIKRAKGHYIHILHGDDYVEKGFYKQNENIFDQYSSVGAIINRIKYIEGDDSLIGNGKLLQNDPGPAKNFIERYFTDIGVNTPGVTVRRKVYEELGGFDRRIKKLGEDREMWLRIARWFDIGYQPEPLAVYRIHDEALTEQITESGEIINDIITTHEIVKSHYAGTKYLPLIQRRKEVIARKAILSGIESIKNKKFRTAKTYLKAGILYSKSPKTIYWILRGIIDKNYK
ncbi:MAG: glycosyltransferase [Bacteroidota bacterium]